MRTPNLQNRIERLGWSLSREQGLSGLANLQNRIERYVVVWDYVREVCDRIYKIELKGLFCSCCVCVWFCVPESTK
jgi:hypothetical protein